MSSNRPLVFGIYKSAERMKRLVNNEYLSDVTFKVGSSGQLIHAHKLIITMASEVFFAQFNGSFAEAKEVNSRDNPVVIEDIESDTFLLIMSYIYCDEIEVTAQNVLDVYYASEKYLLQELVDHCKSFFETAIDESNALILLDNNHRYMFPAVDKKCLIIIQDNPLRYFGQGTFRTLNRRTVEMIAALRTMNCLQEDLQQAIEDWMEANGPDEDEIIPQLEALQCQKLKAYSTFDYVRHINTLLKLTVQKPLKLYGLGIFVGTQIPSAGTEMTVMVTVQGKHGITFFKKVPLKDKFYTYRVMFEPVTVVKTGFIEIKESGSNLRPKLFCLNEFNPIDTLEDCNLQVDTKSMFGVKNNCISYLLYNPV